MANDTSFKLEYDELESFMNKDYLYVENYGWVYWGGKLWEFVTQNKVEVEIADWLDDDFSPYNVKKFIDAYKMYNSITVDELNINPNLITFNNGTYSLKSNIFKENCFMKSNNSTTGFDFDYDVSAEPKLFNEYLNRTFASDGDTIAIVEEMLGYCLLNDCRFEKAFLLYGDGATGKSVLLKVISNIWGTDNCSYVPFDRLNESFMRAGLYGKRINFSSELESDIHNSAYFKAMVSGESIDAQFKFQNTFTFANTAKMIFAMNNLPKIADKTNGTYRRLIILPFMNVVESADRDVHLVEKLLKEKSGIINLAFKGLQRLIANNGFTISELSEEVKAEYKESNDMCSVKEYFKEHIEVIEDTDKVILKDNLYSSYQDFCDRNGFKCVNSLNFFKRMYKINPLIESKRIRIDGKQVYAVGHIVFI